MRRLVMMLTVCLLACSGTVPVLAQEPSPLVPPPPWFGGQRVEMPEYYFAVTLPDDWVAFDATVDTLSQIEAASDFVDPAAWFREGAGFARFMSDLERGRGQLVFVHTTSHTICHIGSLYRGPDVSTERVDGFAAVLYESIGDDPLTLSVEGPERLDLPVGPADLIRESTASSQLSNYLLHSDEFVYMMQCGTDGARPDDDWLSIAETIEFLPAEE